MQAPGHLDNALLTARLDHFHHISRLTPAIPAMCQQGKLSSGAATATPRLTSDHWHSVRRRSFTTQSANCKRRGLQAISEQPPAEHAKTVVVVKPGKWYSEIQRPQHQSNFLCPHSHKLGSADGKLDARTRSLQGLQHFSKSRGSHGTAVRHFR